MLLINRHLSRCAPIRILVFCTGCGTHILKVRFSKWILRRILTHPTGRVLLSDSNRLQYKLVDHLGNTVVFFEDKNGDGTITSELLATHPDSIEVLDRTFYYPFGLPFEGTWLDSTSPEMNYTYNGKEKVSAAGLDWLDYGARWYMPEIGRFTSIDRFANNYPSLVPYNYAGNNPISIIDINGDSIIYSNNNIKNYVESYTSPTIRIEKGNGKVKIKENKKQNLAFAEKIKQLESAEELFLITDDPNMINSSVPTALGEFNIADDGSQFHIVVPFYSSNSEKGKLTTVIGGRGAILAEEVFHATQYLNGELTVSEFSGTYSLGISDKTTRILLEADAKIWVADSGMARLSTTIIDPNYSIDTQMGLIKELNGNRKSVAELLLNGVSKTYFSLTGSETKVFEYPASYSPY